VSALSLLHQFLAYGVLGMVLEVFFTGVGSLIHKNWRATCQTYLWMLPIYGLAGILLTLIHHGLTWHWFPLAFVYLVVMYGMEFVTGWLLEKLIGRCPWHYGLSAWTPMGLINLKYAPFWFALACGFNPIADFLERAVRLLGSV
jgi:uncharacterized membrane protein